MAATNITWVQGTDKHLKLLYKVGATADTAAAIDLSNAGDYSLRMDLVDNTGDRINVFNSEDLLDTDPVAPGDQDPDTDKEVTFANGTGGWNIDIKISRALTLPGGAIYDKMVAETPVLSYLGDVILRDNLTDEQTKILTVNVRIEKSYTLWP